MRRGLASDIGLWVALAAISAVIVVGDWMFRREHPAFTHWTWDVTVDGGLIELFRGALLLLTALFLVRLALRHGRAPVLVAWAGALVLVMVDDVLGIHEAVGAAIAEASGIERMLGLRRRDFGELAVYGVMLLVIAVAVVLTHRRSAPRPRAASWRVGAIAVGVGFVVTAVDMGAIVLDGNVDPRLYYALNVGEAWLEAAGAALLLVAVLVMVRRGLPYPQGLLGTLPEEPMGPAAGRDARERGDGAQPGEDRPVTAPTGASGHDDRHA